MKVLVAENNPANMTLLCDILEKEGYKTLRAISGEEALNLYRQQTPDFVCLDINMDDYSGYSVCREIREIDTQIPIVFISSKSNVESKRIGLEVGADDYIVKPFDPQEVIIRIRAIARRCNARAAPDKQSEAFDLGELKVYPGQQRAVYELGSRTGFTIKADISLREVKILKLFHDNKGKVVTMEMLKDYCWGANVMSESAMVDRHIAQLRKKIEIDPDSPAIIKNAADGGFIFE
jgi:two-component system alkaline phosphatase synthesis response regulator PhoP